MIISLALVVVVLVWLALWKGEGILLAGVKTGGVQLLKFLPIFVIIFLIMGLIEVMLPENIVETWLSDAAGFKGIGIAWLAGILTPAGSIMGFPVVAALYKAGVSTAILVTYITSVALLSFIRIPMEVGFYGIKLTSVRIAATILLPPIAGMLVRFSIQLSGKF